MHYPRLVTALFLVVFVAGCSDSGKSSAGGAPKGMPSPTVGVLSLKSESEPVTVMLPGRAVAFRSADVRPQVGGMIRSIDYKEGSEVKKNDQLFKIEDDSYIAAVAEAKAALAKAQASVPSAQSNLDRYQKLVTSGGATQIELDTAKVTLLQAQADVASSEAALKSATINLEHTAITAPFDGLADVSALSIGNLVTASQTTALTTVRQIDPIYVELTDSSANLLKFRADLGSGAIKRGQSEFPIHLTLENGTVYDKAGSFDVPIPTVSQTTGSFTIRASFPNPDRLIMPGMYVRATLTVGEKQGFLIPQRAASRDADGSLTAHFVGAGNKVESRRFANAEASGNSWLVTSDVKDGDLLIVDGLQSISDGMEVKTKTVTLDDNGVAHATEASAPQKPAATAK
jgi:membrane fusion protein, multidrug efflux system